MSLLSVFYFIKSIAFFKPIPMYYFVSAFFKHFPTYNSCKSLQYHINN